MMKHSAPISRDLLIAAFATLLGVLLALDLIQIFGIIVGIIIIALAYPAPRNAFTLLLIWTFLQNLPRSYLPGIVGQIDLLDELILLTLTLRWIIPILLGRRAFRRSAVDKPVVMFLIFYLVSVVINGVPVLRAALAFRDILQYLLLYYIIINIDFPEDMFKKSIRIISVIAVANFAVLLIQIVYFYVRTGTLFIEDYGVGLMGLSGAHKLGYFAGLLLVAEFARLRLGLRIHIGYVILLGLTIILSSTRSLIFWVPLSMIVLFVPDILSNPKVAVRSLATIGVLAILLFVYIALPITKSATINPKTLYDQQFQTSEGGTLGRIGFLLYSVQTLVDNGVIMGTGPGSYVSKTPSLIGSPLFTKFQHDFPFQNSFNTGSQISLSLVEYGALGFFLLLWIYWRIFRVMGVISKGVHSLEIRSLALSCRAMIILMILCMISNNVFELQVVMIIPWLYAGFVIKLAYPYVAKQSERRIYNLGVS